MSSRFVVTGGNAGLGYFTAEQLARTGASVTIAARSAERAGHALDAIRSFVPGADVDSVRLDLADLGSVRDAAAELAADPIDGIVLNAGVLPWDRAASSAQRYEPTFGTNQLGHFALLAQVFPALTAGAGIVALGSLSHLGRRLRFEAIERDGRVPGAYGHSKLAVMTTAIELDRRARAAGVDVRSVIAHPGYASDANSPERPGITERSTRAYALAVRRIANTKEEGAAITVHALLSGEAGRCYGPGGRPPRLRGVARVERLGPAVLDPDAGRRLWALSEELTGVEFRLERRRDPRGD